MSFRVLYVEHDRKYRDQMHEHFQAQDTSAHTEDIKLVLAKDPQEMDKLLSEDIDLIITDVMFENDKVDKLDEIIDLGHKWAERQGIDPIPIIAHSGQGKDVLAKCVARKQYLYDIWDKSVASPEYVFWRVTRLAQSMNPGSLLQRMIRDMPPGARWHSKVRDMANRYINALSENDQIDQVGHAMDNIAIELKSQSFCRPMWKVMADWEMLSRSASRKIRGHSRHVINVFWLGYLILHTPSLNDWLINVWKSLKLKRPHSETVEDVPALEGLSDIWFYAGLFHDIGAFIEKGGLVLKKMGEIGEAFNKLSPSFDKNWKIPKGSIDKMFEELLSILSDKQKEKFIEVRSTLLSQTQADHGILAAMHMLSANLDKKQMWILREAARATALHNSVVKYAMPADELLTWDEDPIGCLLLLCDQLQTWDRERGDITIKDSDKPESAELRRLSFIESDSGATISLAIDYVAPVYLTKVPLLFRRAKDEMDQILKEHPYPALNNISGSWPFALDFEFSLGNNPLEIRFTFGK